MPARSPRLTAGLQALFVTFLWATSWVFIKIGLRDLPALSFAGLRYTLAALCLLPFVVRPTARAALRGLSRGDWAGLVLLGVLYYTVTQGAQFLGLQYLPAVTVSLLFQFSPVVVAGMAVVMLGERPGWPQWVGMTGCLAGALVYFYPAAIPAGQAGALAVMGVGVLANGLSSVLGRRINRTKQIPPLLVTAVSMGSGALLLLGVGVLAAPLPVLTPTHWAIVGWLAVINTAFAFTLWNHTLRTLSAMESSIINSTLLVQIAVLATLFLGEDITPQQGAGLLIAGLGALLVQLGHR
ncbi:MAG TPA: DMT family transporter [Chloroflexia bacterium]|nr:DMT family transporter [Chloroflexia bacterium]